jgi:ADP-dependent NAD(P)H-hydrate dehydratase
VSPESVAPTLVTPRLLRAWPLPDPHATEGKEDRGRVLVVGGSRRIPGAARLAAEAALRAGAGKLQVATAGSVAKSMAMALPEAMVLALREDAHGEPRATPGEVLDAARHTDALVLGPGLLEGGGTRALVRALLAASPAIAVCDAGALRHAAEATRVSGPRVLTPHAGEMAALLDIDAARVRAAAPALAATLARNARAVVVLKGADTVIAAADGRRWLHRGGGPGLGTSGSGDVLSGLIGGFAARGASPEQAAVWAVFVHARAGARLARRGGTLGFLAREIAAEVPALLG